MRPLQEHHIVNLLARAGVLLQGDHFGLASGRHSTDFIAKTRAGMDVTLTEKLGFELALRNLHRNVDVIIVPGTGAIALGHALAWQLQSLTGRAMHTAIAMRPTVPDSPLVLKRGFPDVVRDRVVLVVQTQNDKTTHDDLMRLADTHGARQVVTTPHMATWIPQYTTVAETLTQSQLLRNMTERADVRSNHAIDVVLVEAGDDIAVGHALALEVGKMQEFNPLLVYAERMYQGELAVVHVPQRTNGPPRVLVGEDVVTTGGSLMETVALAEALGNVVGMAALWNRGTFRDPRLTSLVTRELPSYEPGEATCPQCAANVPINQQYGRGR